MNVMIIGTVDEESPVRRFERFTKNYFFTLCYEFDKYGIEKVSKWRMVKVSIMKVILLVTCLRYALSSLSGSHYIRALMCDSNYLLGQPKIVSLMMSISAFVILFIVLNAQYQEVRGVFCVIIFINSIRNKQLSRGITNSQYRRLILYANIMTKFLLFPIFWSLVIVTNIFMLSATLMAYMDPNSGFTLIGVIFGSIMTYYWTVQFYGIVSVGFIYGSSRPSL